MDVGNHLILGHPDLEVPISAVWGIILLKHLSSTNILVGSNRSMDFYDRAHSLSPRLAWNFDIVLTTR